MELERIKRLPEAEVSATPVLFVHGMFHGAWCWDEYFLPYFAENGYAAYAFSLRGHAGSPGRERLRWTSLSEYVSDLKQEVSKFKNPPILIGHSMGGMIIQKYLQSHQSPAAVLLASVSPKGLIPASIRCFFRHPIIFAKANLTFCTFPVIGTPELSQELFFTPDIAEEKLANCFSQLQDESYRAFWEMNLLPLCPPKPITNTPLLVLGAANDNAISPNEIEATAKKHKTDHEFVPNIAHDMMLEDGWQAVADRILKWLKSLKL